MRDRAYCGTAWGTVRKTPLLTDALHLFDEIAYALVVHCQCERLANFHRCSAFFPKQGRHPIKLRDCLIHEPSQVADRVVRERTRKLGSALEALGYCSRAEPRGRIKERLIDLY